MKNFHFLNRKILKRLFVFFTFFCVAIFLTTFLLNLFLNLLVYKNKISPIPFVISKQAKLAVLKTDYDPLISAKSAIIMDADSNVVLYSKNANLRSSTASTAKIMTALVGLDYFGLNDVLTVNEATVEGSILGLQQGEKMTFENLLYAMLLPSANDAAFTIAQNYPGGENDFVDKMNLKARTLLLHNTNYADPAGLEDSGDYTTAFDLARLASFAIKNSTFSGIVSTKEKIISDVNGINIYDLENLNKLLGEDNVTGVKTGFTKEAGEVLVTSKSENGKSIILVVMGSEDRFLDTQKLLTLVDNNLTYLSIHP